MTQYVINIGTIPNDGTGDPLRTAFNEVNLNFDQVFAAGPVLSNVRIANNTILTTNTNGNLVLAPNGIGVVQANVNIVPNTSNIRNLGAADRRWSTLYIQYANISGAITVSDLTATGNVTVGGNLSVTGNVINIGNIVTDAKTIQLANTAGTANAANGSGITVGANDNIATMLYSSASNSWVMNIGIDTPNIVVNNISSDDSTFVTIQEGLDVQGDITAETVSVTGNVTGNYILGNAAFMTGLPTTYANANVVAYGQAGWAGNIVPSGNAVYSLGNATNQWNDLYVSNTTIFMNNVPITLGAGNVLTVNGNAVLQNNSNTAISTTGNVSSGNVLTGGAVSAVGNVTGNYFIGNGSQLTGIVSSYGNSNVTTLLSNLGSNTINGTGNITTTANVSGAYIKGNGSELTNLPAPTVTQDITSNGAMSIMTYDGVIKYVNYATVEPSSGNITGGNILTGGLISATGNITSGNISTGIITLTNGAVIRDTAGDAVAFGVNAGKTTQGIYGVAIGFEAGNTSQGNSAVAIGENAGYNTQGISAVAVGDGAGRDTQGQFAVALGYGAGNSNQANNSIILNATGSVLEQTTANTFTVKPVRQANTANAMYYHASTGEITYDIAGGGANTGNVTFNDVNIIGTGNLNLQPNSASNEFLNIYLTGNADIHVAAGGSGGNVILGTDEQANVAVLLDGNVAIQAGNVGGTKTWTFDTAGNLILPMGGVVYETNIPDGALSGSAIALTPPGGTNADQQLLVYPTVNDANHLHLTSGNLYSTELFLGSDNLYVKLANTGNVVVNSNNGAGNTAQWTFGTDGRLINLEGLTLTAGGQFNICTILTGGSGYDTGSALKATTGGSGTGMTVGIGYGLSNQLTNADVVDPGTGYVDGDVITVSGGTGGTFVITQYNDQANQGNNNFIESNWTFGAAGNLTLPGNIIAINYANGNRVTGGVTFNGEAVIGTGTSNTQSGLYLAPDPGSLANSLYLRVRGNIIDEPTHIHFDTGNNQYFNQFIGDDLKYIQLANTGNIVVNSNDAAGNTAQWTFGTDGTTTFPAGNITSNTSLQFTTTFANVKTVEYQTAGVWDLYVEDSITGSNTASSRLNVSFKDNLIDKPQVYIENTKESDGIALRWTFDENGTLNFPRDVAGNTDPYLTIVSGANPSISAIDASLAGPANLGISALNTIFTGFTGDAIKIYPDDGEISGDANIQIWSNAVGNTQYSWTFDTTGNLTTPGGMIISGNVNTLGTQTALLQPTDDLPLSFISSGANGTVTSFWAEDFGNLMASNIAAIYTPLQNTQTVRIVTGTNGGNIAIYDFDPDGMFTAAAVCATGNVYAGNVSASGNVTGGNLITTGSGGAITMSGGNITGVGNISAGNISATGNVTAANFFGNGATLSNVATQVKGSWTVPVGNSTQNFTVPINNTYQLWVLGNIPNGIIVYNATVSVSNTNVPVIGQQFAWNYEGGGNILMFTSIPAQIIGTAGAISNASPAVANTNVFSFGINNTSGNAVTVNYGYTKIS